MTSLPENVAWDTPVPPFLPCQGRHLAHCPKLKLVFNISILENSHCWCSQAMHHRADKDLGRREREWLTKYKHILRLPTLPGGSDNIGSFLITTVTFHSLASSAWGIHLRVTLQQDIIPTPFSFGKVVCIFTYKGHIWFGSARTWLAYPFGSLAPWFKVLISLGRQEGLFFFSFF